MTAAELRQIVGAMTGGTWTTEKPSKNADGWQLGVVVAATARGQLVYSDPPGGSYPEAGRKGIAALRNHAEALLDALQIADLFVNDNLTPERLHAVRVAYRCALAKLEAIR